MAKPLNPEKSEQLRPLRIVLAVLVAVLAVLVLDRLPTSVKDRENRLAATENQNERSAEQTSANSDAKYYYLNGFLEILEAQTEAKLKALGVPEEEYQNAAEYFSKDEIFELEAKAILAMSLEEVYVETTEEGIADGCRDYCRCQGF